MVALLDSRKSWSLFATFVFLGLFERVKGFFRLVLDRLEVVKLRGPFGFCSRARVGCRRFWRFLFGRLLNFDYGFLGEAGEGRDSSVENLDFSSIAEVVQLLGARG